VVARRLKEKSIEKHVVSIHLVLLSVVNAEIVSNTYSVSELEALK